MNLSKAKVICAGVSLTLVVVAVVVLSVNLAGEKSTTVKLFPKSQICREGGKSFQVL